MAQTAVRKAYIIQKIDWEYNDEHFFFGGEKVVKAYTDRSKAEAVLKQREEAFRGECGNPCAFAGGLDDATRLTEEQLIASLEELGVKPPLLTTRSRGTAYRGWDDRWWNAAVAAVGADRLDDLWVLFDKVRGYQLVEIDLAEEGAA
jgi:hypothetical protein